MTKYQLAALAVCLQISACSITLTAPDHSTDDIAPEALSAETALETPTRPFPDDSFHDLLVAEFAVRRNRFDLALGNYLQQAHLTGDAGVTARATRLAQYLRADNAALDAAQLWTELEPDNLEAQFTTATLLAKSNRPLEALEHMAMVLKNGGDSNFAAIAASALNLPESDRQALEYQIDQLLVQYPHNTQLMTAKSLLLQQRDEPEAALQLIREVLTLDADELQAVVIEARLLQQLQRGDEAYSRLEQTVQKHPDNRRLRLQYARMLMAKDIELAKQQFELLLESSPNDPDLLLSLAFINREMANIEDARTYLQLLLDSGQKVSEAHYSLGQLAEQQEQIDLAIEHYKQVPLGNDFFAATNLITSLYLKQGHFDTAREYLQGLRAQLPQHSVRLYLMESDLLLSNDMPQQGQRLLTEALLLNPRQPNLLYARSLFSEKIGDYALMEQDLRAIIDLDPNNAIALNALGYVLANRADKLDDAYHFIQRAINLKPDDPAILDSLGWVEYRRGNLQTALNLLTQAYKAFPDHEVAAHLGEVLWQLGEREQAQQIWNQALQSKPQSDILRETILRLSGNNPVTDNPPPAQASPDTP